MGRFVDDVVVVVTATEFNCDVDCLVNEEAGDEEEEEADETDENDEDEDVRVSVTMTRMKMKT